jgi:hypothetical protein
MIRKGSTAINYLAKKQDLDDSAASSHWQEYHQDFSFGEQGFLGLRGFGGYGSRKLGFLHSIMQLRFREMGGNFDSYESFFHSAQKICRSQQRVLDLDVLRNVLSLALLSQKAPQAFGIDKTVCVIGDGFGIATALLVESERVKQVVLVNLTKTLTVDLHYLRSYMGDKFEDEVVLLCADELGSDEFAVCRDAKVVAIEAASCDLLSRTSIDLFINIASMQEMNPSTISHYFDLIRENASKKPTLFYCANREHKVLPDGTDVIFDDYPWDSADKIILEGLVPWHQQYYRFVPPSFRTYDGPVKHRLLEMFEK